MSLNRSTGGTPSNSRVRQPFKSPFRTPGSSTQVGNVNTTPTQTRTVVKHRLYKDYNNCRKDCSEEGNENIKDKSVKLSRRESEGSAPCSSSSQQVVISQSSLLSNSCKKVFTQHFSTPFRSPGCSPIARQTTTPEEQLAQLRKQESDLDEEISSLQDSGYKTEELQFHIDNLHQYNEIKDAAQLVLGRLAEMEAVTVKEMHEKYGVSASD